MLDEIKVYRRSNPQEIDPNTCRVGLGEPLTLFIGASGTSEEQRYFLTKTDPLNKFKKEIEGWWFCEEYVVICQGYDSLKRGFSIVYHRDVWINNRNSRAGGRYVRQNVEPYWKICYTFGVRNSILRFSNIPLKEAEDRKLDVEWKDGKVETSTYSIGEDKYLKLLKLINS